MLTSITFLRATPEQRALYLHLAEGKDIGDWWEEITPGVYVGMLNPHLFIADYESWEEFKDLGPWSSPDYTCAYGVCDSIEQFTARVVPKLQAAETQHVAFLTCIRKADQSPNGGWRWHKWGPYIGDHEPQCEYLYDEEGIDEVYVYHFWTRR